MSAKEKSFSLAGLILPLLVSFGPGLFLLFAGLMLLLISTLTSARTYTAAAANWMPEYYLLLFSVLLAAAAALGGTYAALRAKKWFWRSFFVWVTQQFTAFSLAWLAANIVGGVSMAVVDGSTAGKALDQQQLEFALILLLLLQLLVIPWSAFSGMIIKKFE